MALPAWRSLLLLGAGIRPGRSTAPCVLWSLRASPSSRRRSGRSRRARMTRFSSRISAADRFHPGVLGADREARLRALPTPQRRSALSEIASNSGLDGMELAATLAVTDPDPEVVVQVVELLAFATATGMDRACKRRQTASGKRWGKRAIPITLRMRTSMPASPPSARRRAMQKPISFICFTGSLRRSLLMPKLMLLG